MQNKTEVIYTEHLSIYPNGLIFIYILDRFEFESLNFPLYESDNTFISKKINEKCIIMYRKN